MAVGGAVGRGVGGVPRGVVRVVVGGVLRGAVGVGVRVVGVGEPSAVSDFGAGEASGVFCDCSVGVVSGLGCVWSAGVVSGLGCVCSAGVVSGLACVWSVGALSGLATALSAWSGWRLASSGMWKTCFALEMWMGSWLTCPVWVSIQMILPWWFTALKACPPPLGQLTWMIAAAPWPAFWRSLAIRVAVFGSWPVPA